MSDHAKTIRDALMWAQAYAPDRLAHRLMDAEESLRALLSGHAAEVEQIKQERDEATHAYRALDGVREQLARTMDERDEALAVAEAAKAARAVAEAAKAAAETLRQALREAARDAKHLFAQMEAILRELVEARAENERLREQVLPGDMVCACLDETGSRTVTVWERCERCHAFMRMPDALAAAQEPPAAWTLEKCGASVDGASLTWPYPCPACGERNSFRAQEPPHCTCQSSWPSDLRCPACEAAAQEPPALNIGTSPGQFPGPGLVDVERSLKQAAEPLNPEHYDQPLGAQDPPAADEFAGLADVTRVLPVVAEFVEKHGRLPIDLAEATNGPRPPADGGDRDA